MTKRAFRFRGESLVLDAEARSFAPGEFVELPDGVTHYELAGPDDEKTVVLVHGFSTPYYIWDPTFIPLAEAGFRVLRYDLFGRGYSDRPDAVYDLDLFTRQLLDLLSALNLTLPVDLVGLSMGGGDLGRVYRSATGHGPQARPRRSGWISTQSSLCCSISVCLRAGRVDHEPDGR